MRKDSGFALVTVLILFIIILALGLIMVNLTQKTTKVSFSTVKYESALEAASSGVEVGMSQIAQMGRKGENPEGTLNVKLGEYDVEITVEKILVARAKGTVIEFASGYEGAGKGAGQYFIFYLITSKARGKSGELFVIEANYRDVIKSF